MITIFVAVVMLVIEYLNVLTGGLSGRYLSGRRWRQYVLAGALGATPGCLGAFTVVALYSHRTVTLGAVVSAMIATSGDESFVLLALVPRQALLLTAALFLLGVGTGALTDVLLPRSRWTRSPCTDMNLHAADACVCLPGDRIVSQWRRCSAARGVLATALGLALLAIVTGRLGPPEWNWIRATLLAVTAAALFITGTVPDHFLEEHLWRHVAMRHVPRVFLWTFAALLAMALLTAHLDLDGAFRRRSWIVLAAACALGVIPESGPHLVVVTLYAGGSIPFSILVANSIVQDGHGMLPLLADSRRAFLTIKGINLAAGAAVGAAALAAGH
jgi:hypothetical protein